MEIFLKQGIKVTPVDAYISGNIRDKNFIGIIISDKLNGFFHVKIADLPCRRIGSVISRGKNYEKNWYRQPSRRYWSEVS